MESGNIPFTNSCILAGLAGRDLLFARWLAPLLFVPGTLWRNCLSSGIGPPNNFSSWTAARSLSRDVGFETPRWSETRQVMIRNVCFGGGRGGGATWMEYQLLTELLTCIRDVDVKEQICMILILLWKRYRKSVNKDFFANWQKLLTRWLYSIPRLLSSHSKASILHYFNIRMSNIMSWSVFALKPLKDVNSSHNCCGFTEIHFTTFVFLC